MGRCGYCVPSLQCGTLCSLTYPQLRTYVWIILSAAFSGRQRTPSLVFISQLGTADLESNITRITEAKGKIPNRLLWKWCLIVLILCMLVLQNTDESIHCAFLSCRCPVSGLWLCCILSLCLCCHEEEDHGLWDYQVESSLHKAQGTANMAAQVKLCVVAIR